MEKELIVVLGGMIVREKSGQWRSSEIHDPGDRYGICDDILRVKAAGFLFDPMANQFFLASGGKGQLADNPDAPTISRVIKDELIVLGIPGDRILLEENSKNTLSQLHEIIKMPLSDYKQILIITNECHLPRLETMLHNDSMLNAVSDRHQIKIKSAEDILLAYAPTEWSDRIMEARINPAMIKRRAMEDRGIKDFLAGKYHSSN